MSLEYAETTLINKIFELLGKAIPLVECQWNNITCDIPILVDITQPLTITFKIIYIIEFILIIIAMFLVPYFTHFIGICQVFHKNLTYMMKVFTFVYILACFSRFYMILVQLKIIEDLTSTPFLLIAGFIRMQHYGLSLSAVPVIAIERTFATFLVIDYEAKPRPWIAVFGVLVGFTYTQCFVIPICFYKAPLYYIILYSSLWAIAAKMLLTVLYKYNVKESKRLSWKAENLKKMTNVNYTLSKKYQVEENVKVIGYLQSMGLMLVLLICFVIIFLVVPRVYLGTGTYSGQVMISLFDLNLAVAAIFIPVICIYHLRKFKELPFTQKFAWLNSKDRLRTAPVKDTHEETKTYFEQLYKSWE